MKQTKQELDEFGLGAAARLKSVSIEWADANGTLAYETGFLDAFALWNKWLNEAHGDLDIVAEKLDNWMLGGDQ